MRDHEARAAKEKLVALLDQLPQGEKVSILRFLMEDRGMGIGVLLMEETRKLHEPGAANESFRALVGLDDDGGFRPMGWRRR